MINFFRDIRGGVTVIVGLVVPVLVLGVGASIEYSSIAYRYTQLQRAADAAALAGAQQLRVSNTSDTVVASVAASTVNSVTPQRDDESRAITSAVLRKRTAVQVDVSEGIRSVLGRVMTLPTSQIQVTATAQISGQTKLCLLTLDPSKNKSLYLEAGSAITANGCGLFSNSTDKAGLRADTNAKATAGVICSAGGIDNKGALLSPVPTTDCPAVQDPLASRPRPNTGICTGLEKPLKVTLSILLLPGTYCKGLTISGNAHVTLLPGIYVINDGPLIVTDNAGITGTNVGFFFTGDAGGLRFDPNTTISLTAPKDGAMAGLLFFEDRSVSAPALLPIGPTNQAPPPAPYGSLPMRNYRITSNNAPNLLGTIYLPAGRLVIDASRAIADKSAFTVVIVRQLDLNSGPNLYLNSDYAATDIPVPDGVGAKSGSLYLVK